MSEGRAMSGDQTFDPGFAIALEPADGSCAEIELFGKGTFVDAQIDRAARQAGPGLHRRKTEDSIWGGRCLHLTAPLGRFDRPSKQPYTGFFPPVQSAWGIPPQRM